MRDYETIIKALALPGHFKKYPPGTSAHGTIYCRRLRALIMNTISWKELGSVMGHVFGKKDLGGFIPKNEDEAEAFKTDVKEIWQEMEALEDRTLDEGRMKPKKLYALQDDDTTTVFQVWKVLHDLEQGARKRQSGQTKAIKERDAKIEKLEAENEQLNAALQAAQIALADALQKQ